MFSTLYDFCRDQGSIIGGLLALAAGYLVFRGTTRTADRQVAAANAQTDALAQKNRKLRNEGQQLTPRHSRNDSWVLPSTHDQSLARSGTIDCRPLCGTSCLYRTRLLKPPIIGPWPAAVVSSWIDMLGALPKKE